MTCIFHVDDLQGNHRIKIGYESDIMSKLKIELCFSDNNIRGNGGMYEGCTDPMKLYSKIDFNSSSCCIKEEYFWNKELWES